MLAQLRNLSLRSLRPWSAASSSRHLSASSIARAEVQDEELDLDDAFGGEDPTFNEGRKAPRTPFPDNEQGYRAWIEGEGRQFRESHRPRNWLGGNVTVELAPACCHSRLLTLHQPFPLNPTFKPPSPVSDETRTAIYQQFMTDPSKNNVRELAALHGLSIARVDAILRLKGLEEHWKKVRVRFLLHSSHACVLCDESKSISL